MLVLLFELGTDRYAIDASQVREVLPLVDVTRLPQSPSGVSGVFDFRGTPVPVMDLAQRLLGRPAQARLSTRVIVVDGGDGTLIGLVAERVTETTRRNAAAFVWPGATGGHAQYLGPVARDGQGLLQLIDVRRLLPASGRAALRQPSLDAPWPLQISNV